MMHTKHMETSAPASPHASRTAWLVVAVVVGLIALGAIFFIQKPTYLQTRVSESHMNSMQSPVSTQQSVCTNGHEEGQLEALYAKDNTSVIGWRCVFDPHAVCTAGQDGVFTSCTFSPQEHAWPQAVTAAQKQQPDPPRLQELSKPISTPPF